MPDRQWYAHLQKEKFRLYDLLKVPSESIDVCQKYPDVAHEYLRQLAQWESSVFSKTKQIRCLENV